MRVTMSLDDDLAKRLERLAVESGKSFKQVVSETLQAGLKVRKRTRRAKPYRLRPVSLGGPVAGVDLAKALRLADELEDQEASENI